MAPSRPLLHWEYPGILVLTVVAVAVGALAVILVLSH
jgi:hypothetical protein